MVKKNVVVCSRVIKEHFHSMNENILTNISKVYEKQRFGLVKVMKTPTGNPPARKIACNEKYFLQYLSRLSYLMFRFLQVNSEMFGCHIRKYLEVVKVVSTRLRPFSRAVQSRL